MGRGCRQEIYYRRQRLGLPLIYFRYELSTNTYERTGRQSFSKIGNYLGILHKLVVQNPTSILQGRKVHRCRPWLLGCTVR